MKIDEKAKAYDEMVQRVKELHETGNALTKKQMEIICPELAESEDERVRKWILEYLYDGLRKSDEQFKDQFKSAIAYLEKQEELDKMIVVSPEVWDSAISDAFENGKKEGEKQKEQDKCPEYCVRSHCIGCSIYEKQKARWPNFDTHWENGSMACEQKQQKLNPDKEKLIRHCIGLILTDATGERFKDYGLTLKDCLTWLDEQKEQKPTKSSDDELQRHMDELYDFKVFAAKQAREYHISFVHDFEWNNFCAELLSYFNKQKPDELDGKALLHVSNKSYDIGFRDGVASVKPVEWSEEDDQLIGFIFDLLNSLVWRKEWAMDKKECLERLKSLHPSWKPSEWQMSMLLAVINDPNNAGSESCYLTLKSIYEQLKKL